MCSGIAYYVQGTVIKERGPVFVTAFSPLCMIITAALGAFVLSEQVHLGRYNFDYLTNYLHFFQIDLIITLIILISFFALSQSNRKHSHSSGSLLFGVG